MQPVIVMPLNDPTGVMFPLLESVSPLLRQTFAFAFVSITAGTAKAQPQRVDALRRDAFFQILQHADDLLVGEDFALLYSAVAEVCPPRQVLHLGYIDRVAYALSGEHRAQFLADVLAVQPAHTPLVFQRSERAWQTHPRNYCEIEAMVTRASEWLFGRPLDFAWCHLAVQAQQLRSVMRGVSRKDISMVAEMLLPLRHAAQIKEVDWLAWEDPFVFGREAGELKREREASLDETRKRLAYAIPMLELLYAASRRDGQG